MNNRLIEIVNHHIAVFDFFNRADDLFTYALFAQYIASGAMICGVLFSISTVTDHLMTPNFFHVAFFYSGLIIQLYTNCFYGSQVFVTSENIRQHAYFCGWEDSGKYMDRIQTTLNMMMMRSKRACRLTAGKFAAVDLPTFLAVFKASYTYYTVLVDDDRR
ncbi:odorant receptor 94a-like [Sitodiplosis mosellana]|uniref:odorant receptor 94a-like n=1 Tax=Sitodiplosis mosellana TaxID=263140 RepID=UPI002443C9B4|nr:odorant receptor 94a-like [Sitodiplosis mosellana]